MEKLWFKAKCYGYGWYPATWQGWLVLGVYLVVLIAAEIVFIRNTTAEHYSLWHIAMYLVFVALITGVLIWISYKKGEPAHWRWGK